MMNCGKKINDYLSCLIGTPLQYGIKKSDFDLFQLGFGDVVSIEYWNDRTIEINKYAIHFDSALYVCWMSGKIEKLYSDVDEVEFNEILSKIVGNVVKRIALSEKNDLWIDLGECKLVIVTREDNEESWRLFQPRTARPHLIATNCVISFDY